MLYWTRQRGEFVVGKGGATCDMLFYVAVDDGEVVIARQDRAGGKAVKEETRTVSLIDFVDAIHRLWENAK
jgi:predicted enzyme related to lactoylglutathione lyase